jgi:hypothetical protein
MSEVTPPPPSDDCRCATCGCCKHDHGGWNHTWTSR